MAMLPLQVHCVAGVDYCGRIDGLLRTVRCGDSHLPDDWRSIQFGSEKSARSYGRVIGEGRAGDDTCRSAPLGARGKQSRALFH